MKAYWSVLAAALAAASQAQAGTVGSQSATWLLLPDSARTAAMAQASVAVADDADTVSVNPAGLAGIGGQQVSLLHNANIQETSFEHAAYGVAIDSVDGLALAVNYMNYGSIQGYTVTNGTLAQGNTLNPYGMDVDLGYGRSFGSLSAGVGAKLVTEYLGTGSTNSTGGVDLGLLWRQEDTRGLSVGAAVQNLGGQLDGADLPTNIQAGLAYRLPLPSRQRLTLAGDVAVPTADTTAETLSLGGEYAGSSIWALRAGYKYVGDNGLSGISVGGGLTYEIATFDYAFVDEGALGASNQFSLSLKF